MTNREDGNYIFDLKHRLLEKAVFQVISHSLYQPTEEKWEKLAKDYQRDQNIAAFGWIENGNIYGVMILKRLAGDRWEIQHIATHPEHRNRKIASRLISCAANRLNCGVIQAETDRDAVGFYQGYGFSVQCLGEKYPGCTRYLCTLSLR